MRAKFEGQSGDEVEGFVLVQESKTKVCLPFVVKINKMYSKSRPNEVLSNSGDYLFELLNRR